MESASIKSIYGTNIEVIEPVLAELVSNVGSKKRSWIFRSIDSWNLGVRYVLGTISIVFCTAIAANIPIIQFMSFGFLLEASGRVGRGGKISDGMVGISKAARIGTILLGTWLLLIPIRFFSESFWYEAYLIDPSSNQTYWARVIQIVLIGLTLLQIVAAWICGGKLRYFFWQIIAPFSFGLWTIRKMLGSKITRPVLSKVFNWISPNLTNDICNAQPLSDWFVPAILWSRIRSGSLYNDTREGLWSFFADLNLWKYWRLGIVGFAGSAIWLFVPTILLIGATQLTGPAAGVCSFLGITIAVPIFTLLLFIQTHFAAKQTFASFFHVREVIANFRRAPLAHILSLFVALLFALPLFFAKIEEIPSELLWTLSLLFVAFSWPSRIAVGLAYRRAARKTEAGRWWIRWPQMVLALPISAAFVVILFFSRYVSWHGAYSMIENHVFLLPAPFWL